MLFLGSQSPTGTDLHTKIFMFISFSHVFKPRKTPSRRSRGTTFDFERPGDKPKVKVEYEKSKGDKDQNPRVGVRVL